MHTDIPGSSKKRRMRCERMFRFKNFCDPGHPIHFKGVFQENLRTLLDEFGRRETTNSHGGGMQCWSFQLGIDRISPPPRCVSLIVAEEVVERSRYRHCRHCRSVGWGHHMICNKRFHFVLSSKKTVLIKSDETSDEVVDDGKGGDHLAATTESKLMNLQGQMMHGVVHSNGFGHLLCVNGIEGGSEIVSGYQIVDLWDRICTGLGLRKASLTDTAKRGTMDLRLIHGLAYGEPWFGRWGYKFGRGSYGVTQQMYHNSVEALRNLPLCLLLVPADQYGSSPRRQFFPAIVAKYQAIAGGNSLLTLGHLFHFMLELKRRLPPDTFTAAADYRRITAEPACRWSVRRVEMAAQVIVDALKKAEFRWVSRQDVRDAARAYVGDTGLLDFVLKSLGNHVVGSYIVRRTVNPATKILEYCLEDISINAANFFRLQTTRVQLMKDLLYLYECILKDQNYPTLTITGLFSMIPAAVRIILDTKQLVKDYRRPLPPPPPEVGGGDSIKLLCTVNLTLEGRRQQQKALPPHELLTLPAQATVAELKSEVEKSFKELYVGLKSFAAESVADVDADDTDLVCRVIESGSSIVVNGKVTTAAAGGEEIYEGGNSGDDYRSCFDCTCGAKEEDGERMVSCDICGVWQHTRCVGISDGEDVPHIFLCGPCENDIAALPSLLS